MIVHLWVVAEEGRAAAVVGIWLNQPEARPHDCRQTGYMPSSATTSVEAHMRLRSLMLIALFPSMPLAGCNRDEHSTAEVEKHLTVTGPQSGVKRFAKLQGSLRPALRMSAIQSLGNGRARATVMLPANSKGEDLVHTTREALAAGLNYRFVSRKSVRTVKY